MSNIHSYKATVREMPESGEVEIRSSIEANEFDEAVKTTLGKIREEMTLHGFRKGSVPEKMVREKVGETTLLYEAAEHAISHAYGHILQAEKIDAIGQPKVSITKMAVGNPLEFTIVTAVVPKIGKLDYKKIAVGENSKPIDLPIVTDEELAKAKEKMPEVTKENLIQEKEHRAKEKKRLELIDALTKNIEVIIPTVLTDSELMRMIEQMKHDIERMGLKFEDYLKHLKKSEEEMRVEWRPQALQRVKLDLVLSHIAREEKIVPDMIKVEEEIKHAKEHHKGIDENRARMYFSHIFENQAVFEFLEGQK
ncbi:MAG: trigger factor [bacterium]|nr:trigger factor [bacterium]